MIGGRGVGEVQTPILEKQGFILYRKLAQILGISKNLPGKYLMNIGGRVKGALKHLNFLKI